MDAFQQKEILCNKVLSISNGAKHSCHCSNSGLAWVTNIKNNTFSAYGCFPYDKFDTMQHSVRHCTPQSRMLNITEFCLIHRHSFKENIEIKERYYFICI